MYFVSLSSKSPTFVPPFYYSDTIPVIFDIIYSIKKSVIYYVIVFRK